MKEIETREIKLKIWEEIVGDCVELSVEDDYIAVYLTVNRHTSKVVFPYESEEGCILRKTRDKLVGKKIGILRTDDSARPIVVKIFDSGSLGGT